MTSLGDFNDFNVSLLLFVLWNLKVHLTALANYNNHLPLFFFTQINMLVYLKNNCSMMI